MASPTDLLNAGLPILQDEQLYEAGALTAKAWAGMIALVCSLSNTSSGSNPLSAADLDNDFADLITDLQTLFGTLNTNQTNETNTIVTALNNLSTSVTNAIEGQQDFSELIVIDTTDQAQYIRQKTRDEDGLNPTVEFFNFDGTLASPQPSGPFISGAGDDSPFHIVTSIFEATATPGAIQYRHQSFTEPGPAGAATPSVFWTDITGNLVSPPLPGEFELVQVELDDLVEASNTLLSQIQTLLSTANTERSTLIGASNTLLNTANTDRTTLINATNALLTEIRDLIEGQHWAFENLSIADLTAPSTTGTLGFDVISNDRKILTSWMLSFEIANIDTSVTMVVEGNLDATGSGDWRPISNPFTYTSNGFKTILGGETPVSALRLNFQAETGGNNAVIQNIVLGTRGLGGTP